MGNLIASAAHFVVCECEKHGRVIAADGKEGFDVCSQEDALASIERGVECGFITEIELRELKRQVGASPLPRCSRDAHPLAVIVSEYKNIASRVLLTECEEYLEREADKEGWKSYPDDPPVVH